jgi:hypothetical protein
MLTTSWNQQNRGLVTGRRYLPSAINKAHSTHYQRNLKKNRRPMENSAS